MKKTRNTPQKQLVRRLMKENYQHPTAEQVYLCAREQCPTISRGTVYRNLNFLAQQNEISRVSAPQGPDHYDYNTHNHYHFLCEGCNSLLDMDMEYDDTINKSAPKGCRTIWHKLLLVGLCSNCSKVCKQ